MQVAVEMILGFIFADVLCNSHQTGVRVLSKLRLGVHEPAGLRLIMGNEHIGLRQLLCNIDALLLGEEHVVAALVPERTTDASKAHAINGFDFAM